MYPVNTLAKIFRTSQALTAGTGGKRTRHNMLRSRQTQGLAQPNRVMPSRYLTPHDLPRHQLAALLAVVLCLILTDPSDARHMSNDPRICWDGPGLHWGGQPIALPHEKTGGTVYSKDLSQSGKNIFIAGEGCRHCVEGDTCSFRIAFASQTLFDMKSAIYRELMITLRGPSLVHAYAMPHQGHLWGTKGFYFDITYRPWEAGNYTLVIQGDCSSDEGNIASRQLAQLPVTVAPALPDGNSDSTKPCENQNYGRWLLDESAAAALAASGDSLRGGNEAYRWRWFRCSGVASAEAAASIAPGDDPLPESVVVARTAGELAEKLIQKGVKEIALQGDSHTYRLFQHIVFALSGEVPVVSFREDNAWHYTSKSGGSQLRFNYQWVPGIYPRESPRCSRPDGFQVSSYPVFSPTADVIVLNAAHWTFNGCKQPHVEFSRNLPLYLEWSLGLPRKEGSRMFWRSSPPFSVSREQYTCSFRRNSALFWANEYARTLTEQYGLSFLDTWNVEAPRFGDMCQSQDPSGNWREDYHYTCPYDNQQKLHGAVGEATTLVFLQALASAS